VAFLQVQGGFAATGRDGRQVQTKIGDEGRLPKKPADFIHVFRILGLHR
jgi:hypothetical protein